MDLISRQKAKDAIDMALDHIDHVPSWVYDKLLNALNELPSVQITPCEFCKHNNIADDKACLMCSAERRTDE